MPEAALNLLLDENIPQSVTEWMRKRCPAWSISHVKEVGLERLISQVPIDEWTSSLIIVDREKIRLRKKP